MPRNRKSWWEEDSFDDISQSIIEQRDQLVEDDGMHAWEQAWLDGYEEAR